MGNHQLNEKCTMIFPKLVIFPYYKISRRERCKHAHSRMQEYVPWNALKLGATNAIT